MKIDNQTVSDRGNLRLLVVAVFLAIIGTVLIGGCKYKLDPVTGEPVLGPGGTPQVEPVSPGEVVGAASGAAALLPPPWNLIVTAAIGGLTLLEKKGGK